MEVCVRQKDKNHWKCGLPCLWHQEGERFLGSQANIWLGLFGDDDDDMIDHMMMIICLVFDIKRDGSVQVAKQHSENLGVNVRDQDLTILIKYSLKNILLSCEDIGHKRR